MSFLPLKGLFDQFQVIIGGVGYPIDRLFLAAKSPLLKAELMLNDTTPRAITSQSLDLDTKFFSTLGPLDVKDVKSLLTFIYEGKLEGSLQTSPKLVQMVGSLGMTVPHRWFSRDFDLKRDVTNLRTLWDKYPSFRQEIQWCLMDDIIYWEIQDCLLIPLSQTAPASAMLNNSHKCFIARLDLEHIEYRLFYRTNGTDQWQTFKIRSEPLMIKSCNPDEDKGLRGEPVVVYYEPSKPNDILESKPLPDMVLLLTSKAIPDKDWKSYIYVKTPRALDKLKLVQAAFTAVTFI